MLNGMRKKSTKFLAGVVPGLLPEADRDELALIRQIRQRAARQTGSVRLGIGDDCAVFRPRAGEDLVLTTDYLIEDVHFRRDTHSAGDIGVRAAWSRPISLRADSKLSPCMVRPNLFSGD